MKSVRATLHRVASERGADTKPLRKRVMLYGLYAYAFLWGFVHPFASDTERVTASCTLALWARRRGLL
jgi:hypothetical protein